MGATFAPYKTYASLEVLTASDLNSSITTILNNFTPAGMDDLSATLAEMRTETDPYPSGAPSQATALQGELERIRYQLRQLVSQTYWYEDPLFREWDEVAAPGAPTADKLRQYAADVGGVSLPLCVNNPGARPAMISTGPNLCRGSGMESWSAGASAAPDGFTVVGAAATVARDGTNFNSGVYAAALTRAGTDCQLERDCIVDAGAQAFIRSRVYLLIARVRATVASRARLRINDGVGSSFSAYHTGGSAFETLAVIRALDAAATALKVGLQVDTGDTAAQLDDLRLYDVTGFTGLDGPLDDQVLRLTNFQASTPANNIDQGLWRAELGQASIAGNPAASFVTTAITFQTAFRTIRAILVTLEGLVGAKRGLANARNKTASGFDLVVDTADNANFSDGSTGTCVWVAIGQV